MRKLQSGFTLIEITAVLVIMGILTVIAIPGFITIQEQSRLSASEGIAAGYSSGISLVYANALAGGGSGSTTNIDAECKVAGNAVATHEGQYTVVCTATTLNNNVTITVTSDGGPLSGTPTVGTLNASGALQLIWQTPEI